MLELSDSPAAAILDVDLDTLSIDELENHLRDVKVSYLEVFDVPNDKSLPKEPWEQSQWMTGAIFWKFLVQILVQKLAKYLVTFELLF